MSQISDILESLVVACDDYHDPAVISYMRDEIERAEEQLNDYIAVYFMPAEYPEEM